MLTNFLYNGKIIQTVENKELKKLLAKSKNRIWIKASNITQEEKIILKEIFKIHPTTIEDISTRHTRIKYEEFEEYTSIIFKGVKKINETSIDTYNISFIIEELSKNSKKIETFLKKDEDYIAHYILDKEVDRDLNIKIEFGDVLKQIERKFIEKHDREILKKLFSKELLFLEFRQLMESITDVCLNLTKPADNYINNDLIPYFRDVYDHAFKT